MYEFQSICRKKIAMVISDIACGDVIRIYAGNIILSDKGHYYFVSCNQHWEIEIESDIIRKLQPVSLSSKDILLDADYFFSMEITELKSSLFIHSLLNA